MSLLTDDESWLENEADFHQDGHPIDLIVKIVLLKSSFGEHFT